MFSPSFKNNLNFRNILNEKRSVSLDRDKGLFQGEKGHSFHALRRVPYDATNSGFRNCRFRNKFHEGGTPTWRITVSDRKVALDRKYCNFACPVRSILPDLRVRNGCFHPLGSFTRSCTVSRERFREVDFTMNTLSTRSNEPVQRIIYRR